MQPDAIVDMAISLFGFVLREKMSAKVRAKVITQLKRLVKFGLAAIDALTTNDEKALAKLVK